MTTLALDTPRVYEGGNVNELGVIASDIIYEGAAVGDNASGIARPLVAGDKFRGFAEYRADNSDGAASDIRVRFWETGKIKLAVTGAVITDIKQPIYASDDNAFTFSPVGNSYVGVVHRFVASGSVIVDFDANAPDPYGDGIKETISANKTLDALDTGKTFFVDTDATTTTLPATATALLGVMVVNIGAFGAVAINLSPQAADKVHGPDLAGTADKDHINTKATAQRGDYVVVSNGHADGPVISDQVGTWATEG